MLVAISPKNGILTRERSESRFVLGGAGVSVGVGVSVGTLEDCQSERRLVRATKLSTRPSNESRAVS